jgi:hypothetical protein
MLLMLGDLRIGSDQDDMFTPLNPMYISPWIHIYIPRSSQYSMHVLNK